MNIPRLPFDASLDQYQQQAETVLAAQKAGDREALEFIHDHHPRFRRPDVAWLPKNMTEAQMREEAFDVDDARLALAYWYCLHDWPALAHYVEAVTQKGSLVHQLESAVEAVIDGDIAT